MGTLNDWTVVDANNNAAPPDGWPENTMQYSDVNNTGRAVQGTLRRYFGDVGGSLAAAGAVNAYTLTLNETGYIAYFAGMYFACSIPITNTGAVTIDVNSIGVQSIITQDGTALAGGELMAGGIYEFRYDGTDFQLLGAAGVLPSATLSNANLIDLVDTDVALRTGASDPDTAQHMEFSTSQIQSKSNATTAAALSINSLGGNLQLGAQSGTGLVRLWNGGTNVMTTLGTGIRVGLNSDAGERVVQQQNDIGGIQTVLDNVTAGVELQQLSAAGAVEDTWLSMLRNGAVTLYEDGNPVAFTQPEGFAVRAATTDNPSFQMFQDDGSTRNFFITAFGAATTIMRNEVDGENLNLEATDAGSVARVLVSGDPDGATSLYRVGVRTAGTLTAAAGGLEANNTLTGAGFERVLTTSDLSAGGVTGSGANNELAIWDGASSIEGDPNLIYDSVAQRFTLQDTTTVELRILATGAGGTDEAVLQIEQSNGARGVAFVQENGTFEDFSIWQTNGAGTRGNQIMNFGEFGRLDFYHSGVLVARTTTLASHGFEVSDSLGFHAVLGDNSQNTIEGGQRFGGWHSDGAGITTTTIGVSNINDFNGTCIEASSGDTLRFATISGASPSILDAGMTFEAFSGTITVGASNISVDIWEVQASGTTYHNLSGTSTFTITGPAIGAFRYLGSTQVVGFIFAV